MIRKAQVAGGFYPFSETKLIRSIEESFSDPLFGPGNLVINFNPPEMRNVIGGICPHAGYIYSGAATAHTIKAIFEDKCPDTIIILGTSHTGYRGIALMKAGKWETPLGLVSIDTKLAETILSHSEYLKEDNSAFFGYHAREHNIEVQIPFLQYAAGKYNKSIEIIPIKVGDMNLKHLEQLGKELGQKIAQSEKNAVILSSSDMTHKQPNNYYQPTKDLEDMYQKDKAVFDSVTNYDWNAVFENATKTSVCGPQTIVTGMIACKEMGAKQSNVLKYYTSYEKLGGTGPCEYSVGYLSAIFTR
ncbi:MAG: AmmeMemoRadiSam system protein B [Candidatus Lokiarchaeota archaeon]|nr:AmmeMemoRadiSam system protein B [Candidatus Lokiarchaeota archaeon]